MDPVGQIFQISKFPNTLSFVLIPRIFWQTFTKISQIYKLYSVNSLKVVVFLPKSNARFELMKLVPCQETISPPETSNQ